MGSWRCQLLDTWQWSVINKQPPPSFLFHFCRALALNCSAPINDKEGAEAKDWRAGKPVRVVRNVKGGRHSKYAPVDGNRYDGIYKVRKWFFALSCMSRRQYGFKTWRKKENLPAIVWFFFELLLLFSLRLWDIGLKKGSLASWCGVTCSGEMMRNLPLGPRKGRRGWRSLAWQCR